MNTPAHAVAGLLLLAGPGRSRLILPVFLGSIAPDLPMILFYAQAKLLARLPEDQIWSQAYYHPWWQAVFDLAGSLPLIALGAVLARFLGWTRSFFFLAALGLHALADLLLHHHDAHRHFLPFSDWRFLSPVSYWDPAHYGAYAAPLEAGLVLLGSVILWRRFSDPGPRLLVTCLVAVYIVYGIYVFLVWV